jgi:hypothetical protein
VRGIRIQHGEFLVNSEAVYVGAGEPSGIANAVMYLENNPGAVRKITISAKGAAVEKFSVDAMEKKAQRI